MNHWIKRFFAVLTAAVMLLGAAFAQTPGMQDFTVEEHKAHEAFQRLLDEGNSAQAVQMLLDGEISEQLYAFLLQEDAATMEIVIADAMAQAVQQGDLMLTAQLREKGYATDAILNYYWESTGGSELTGEAFLKDAPEVDLYLLHAFVTAFQQDQYAVRSLMEMRRVGMIGEEMHAALVEALGFDYTDELYMDENGIAALRELTAEEKAVYEQVLVLIDEGDAMSVLDMMLAGEMTLSTYYHLMRADRETMEFAIAYALAQLVQAQGARSAVLLRVNGFLSDGCFENYWDTLGTGMPREDEDLPGVDRYLLNELEQIALRTEDGKQVLRDCWQSGLIGDRLQEALIERLGFDYTKD